MNLSKSSNPVFGANAFTNHSQRATYTKSMTLDGVVNKTFVMLILVIASAFFTWDKTLSNPSASQIWMIGGMIIGLISALVVIFKKSLAYIFAPIYAIAEGLFLGALSALINIQYPGIPLQAVALTFGTFFVMLVAYRMGWIRATQKFRAVIVAATGGIALVYLVSWVIGFFGVSSFIHGNSLFSIGFSLVVVVIAALNLILDFSFIENSIRMGAPKQLEWYASFGLIVTLIWLYLEFLRLLSKLNSRD